MKPLGFTESPEYRMPEPLGLESKMVRVVPYDDRWPLLFEAEAHRLSCAVAASRLPNLALEHVGSTAVPGLAAKPILDIAAGSNTGIAPAAYIGVLEALGYVYRGDGGVPGREFFRLGALRSHHLHLVERSGPHWPRYLRFRNALRADPALRDAYAAIKRSLAARYPRDREAYIGGKTEFVEGVLRALGRDVPDELARGED
jgi:GrpB-like predicted nucleotidyltransferase (UPF0157 family)